MVRPLAVVLLLLASSARAEEVFTIGPPSHATAAAQMVASDDQYLYTISTIWLTRASADGVVDKPIQVRDALCFPELGHAAAGGGLVLVSCGGKRNGTIAITPAGEKVWTVEGVAGRPLFDGTNFIVLDGRNPGLRATWIDVAGNVLRSAVIAPDAHTGDWGLVADANAEGMFVAWREGMELKVLRVDVDGRVARPPVVVGTTYTGQRPAIAAHGSEALVAWVTSAGGDQVVDAVRIDRHGRAFTGRRRLAKTGSLRQFLEIVLAWDGRHYRFVWIHSDRNDSGARAEVRDVSWPSYGMESAQVPEDSPKNASIHVFGSRVAFLFNADRGFGPTRARIIDAWQPAADVASAPVVPIHLRPETHRYPAVTWTGDRYVAVWIAPDDPYVLMARELSADGAPLGPPVVILRGEFLIKPRVAATREVTLIAWFEDFNLRVIRLGRGLERIDEQPVTLERGHEIDVATNGRDFVIAWTPDAGGIRARIVPAHGPIADEPPMVVTAPGYGPRVAWPADRPAPAVAFLTAFTWGCIPMPCFGSDVYAADLTGPTQGAVFLWRDGHMDDLALSAGDGSLVVYTSGSGGGRATVMPGYEIGYRPPRFSLSESWDGGTIDFVWTGMEWFSIANWTEAFYDRDFHPLGTATRQRMTSFKAAASSGDGRVLFIWVAEGAEAPLVGTILRAPQRE